ncbi:MAG: hypothetical protein DRZ90_08490 [Spirochaetes bacterium]|nr:MAG: hypothetical protein DRZ90_08490 [Spirochaetota bacterium]
MVSRAAGRQNKSAEIQKTESRHTLIPLQPLKIPNWFIPDPIWGCFGLNSAPNGFFWDYSIPILAIVKKSAA